MNLIACTYVDHQEEILYPVAYAALSFLEFDKIYLFGSDIRSVRQLEQDMEGHPLARKIVIEEIGSKVFIPEDIAAGQNLCLDFIRRHETFDYVLFFQADLKVTKHGLSWIKEFLAGGDSQRPAQMLLVKQIFLHLDIGFNHFGCALVGRGSNGARFVHDGAYMETYQCSSYDDKNAHCLSVGWLGIDQCKRHFRRHARTWNVGHMAPEARRMGELSEIKDDREFARQALGLAIERERRDKGNRFPNLMSVKSFDYMSAVGGLCLRSERALCEDVFWELKS